MANMPSLSTFPLAAVLAQARSLAGTSQVRSGLSLSAVGAGSLGVVVAAGTAWVDSTYVSSVGGTVTPGAASATLARYDLIVIASGAVVPSIVAGTAASAPAPPALPAGALFLGYVFIGPGATDYTVQATAFIADYTMPVTLPVGTAAAPALPPAGDLTTGWAFPGTGRAQQVTGGVARWETTSLGHLVPVSTSITDLGTSSQKWRDAHVVSLHADMASVSGTIIASTASFQNLFVNGSPIAAGGLTQLAEIVTSISVANVDFTNIASTYEHLMIVWQGLTMTGAVDLTLRFNGGATSYFGIRSLATSAGVATTRHIAATEGNIGRIADNTDGQSGGVIYINSYARPNMVARTARSLAYARGATTSAGITLADFFTAWNSSNAVSRITLIPGSAGASADWASGAVITLFGMG